MNRAIFFLTLFLVALTAQLLTTRCSAPEAAAVGPVQFDPAAAPYPHLSDYAFFSGELRRLEANAGVLPYELITPLFTDYAHKARFVWMPDSVEATVDAEGNVLFPDNTVLIKNFYYPADFSQPDADWDLVETRLLMRRAGKWDAYTYVWNEEQTEAKLNLVGAIRPVSWRDEAGVDRQIQYVVPNKNQCKSCHNRRNTFQPIGPKVRNLNKPVTDADGRPTNQLQGWQAAGLLAAGDYAAQFQPVAAWDDPAHELEARALAYLDVNCGHCHHPEGPAHTTGLFLTVDYAEDPVRLGFCKSPVAAGRGSGDRRFGIAPGRPDQSILVYRMEADDPGVMMPEIGRVIPHSEGIKLVRQWIAGLEGDCR